MQEISEFREYLMANEKAYFEGLERKINLLFNERLLTPKDSDLILICKAEIKPAQDEFPSYQQAVVTLKQRNFSDRLFTFAQREDSWLATELFAVFMGLIEVVGYQPMQFVADGMIDGLLAEFSPEYKGKNLLVVVQQKQLYMDLTETLEPESRTHLLKPCRDVLKALGAQVICIENEQSMYKELEVYQMGV